MEHVGEVSTLRDEPHPESLPRCNDFLGVSASFKSVSRSGLSSCGHQPTQKPTRLPGAALWGRRELGPRGKVAHYTAFDHL